MRKWLIALLVSLALLPTMAPAHTRVFVGIGGGWWAPGWYHGYYGPAFGIVVRPRPWVYYPPPVYYAPPPAVIVEPPPAVIYRDHDCYWRDGVKYCYDD